MFGSVFATRATDYEYVIVTGVTAEWGTPFTILVFWGKSMILNTPLRIFFFNYC